MTTVQIRTQAATKKNAQEVLAELGLDLTTAINMYLIQIVKHGGIPFDVLTENSMTLQAEKQLLAAKKEMESSKEVYNSAKTMHAAILAE